MINIKDGYDGKEILRMPRKKREKLADKFCEGSEELKKLLLKLWDHNIETAACCIGHYNGDYIDYDDAISPTYVAIRYNKNTREYLNTVFSYIVECKKYNTTLDIITKDGEQIFMISADNINEIGMLKDLTALIGIKAKRKKEYMYIELLMHEIKKNNAYLRYNFESPFEYYDAENYGYKDKRWFVYGNISEHTNLVRALTDRLVGGRFDVKRIIKSIKVNPLIVQQRKDNMAINRKTCHQIPPMRRTLAKKMNKNKINKT